MPFPDLFKLEKLTIEAFQERERKTSLGKVEAMFNPTTLSQRYGVKLLSGRTKYQEAKFERVLPTTLNFKLLFDGTGVDQIGLLTLFGSNPTVAQRIDALLTLCYSVKSESHEPTFLKITWGTNFLQLKNDGFRGRLSTVTINYTSFDRDGSPLRAECDLTVVGDDALERQASATNLASPDLSHSRLVRAGDTLPLLTAAIYGTSRHTVKVAAANDLDQLRTVAPGQVLIFPPIVD